ncbi:hypothetical protein Q669_10975 [Labrenzia sp. C1B10]|uniref:hypothetical protein n=1 Tax=unclassified Labrenzia TaxID=2648686 RepID=UPI0003B8A734|nr:MULTISPECIES: hypothetical protein [unclassified Labrenzia]ERP87279.1 hypothetical protein Q669_10975 [Labrenzia sp. C1B10]ERS07583.1 hypothetical protein Q675_19610 [Labrenzia sp. C1B70]
MDYRGWIPTVSGRLAFSEFGNLDYPTKAAKWSYADKTERCVICVQKRYLSDITIPILSYSPEILDFIDNYLFGKTGKMWMCATASYDMRENSLTGIVGIFGKKIWRRYKRTLEESGDKLNNTTSKDDEPWRYLEAVNSLNLSHAFATAEYKVLRNGKIFIGSIKSGEKSNIEWSEETEENIASQVYFFLKDCLHRHQHHSKTTDSILSIYKIDPKKSIGRQEKEWKLDVLYTLYRKVINRRRNGSLVDLSESMGVLSYASSFYNIFKKELEGFEEKSVYNRTELIESLKASIISSKYKENKMPELLRGSLSITLALSAVAIAFASLLGVANHRELEVSEDLVNVVSFVLLNPFQATLFGASIIMSVALMLHSDYLAKIVPNKLLYDTIRIIVPLKQWILDALIFIFLGLFLYTSYHSIDTLIISNLDYFR